MTFDKSPSICFRICYCNALCVSPFFIRELLCEFCISRSNSFNMFSNALVPLVIVTGPAISRHVKHRKIVNNAL